MSEFKPIYRIAKGDCDWTGTPAQAKTILGGKGAGLVAMTAAGLPVPPAFTITTQVCNQFLAASEDERSHLLSEVVAEAKVHWQWLAGEFGYWPLVSVRSGAPVSMPGMMDTILNVGLTLDAIDDWADRIGKRPAKDSYRRLIQMLGSTAYGVPKEEFESILTAARKADGVETDAELAVDTLGVVIEGFLNVFQQHTGQPFPDAPYLQLEAAIEAVFLSWCNPRAIEYRKLNKIDEAMGTAVTVQAMVFGNAGDNSGTGVLFSRDPATGRAGFIGEFLPNAQGEDVVAGIRTPRDVHDMLDMPQPYRELWQVIHAELQEVCQQLEATYKDMVDIEFTVQHGKLFILQSRTGKRSALAGFRIAADLVAEGVVLAEVALSRLTRAQFKAVSRPILDPSFKTPAQLVGLPACPGVVTGRPVLSSEAAVAAAAAGETVILVTHETTPDDIAGMAAAVGILTQTGGITSHAAVVARGMDKPCITGCTALSLTSIANLSKISIDGSTGHVWYGEVPVVDASNDPAVATVTGWAMDAGGYALLTPAPLPDYTGAQVITVSDWWGNEDALQGVIKAITAMTDRSNITIDLTPPAQLRPAEDEALAYIFDVEPPAQDQFAKVLRMRLSNSAALLSGVTLANTAAIGLGPMTCAQMGFKTVATPETVADLLKGPVNPPTPAFIQKVCGGQEAFDALKAALNVKVVRQPVPTSYAVFRQLAG